MVWVPLVFDIVVDIRALVEGGGETCLCVCWVVVSSIVLCLIYMYMNLFNSVNLTDVVLLVKGEYNIHTVISCDMITHVLVLTLYFVSIGQFWQWQRTSLQTMWYKRCWILPSPVSVRYWSIASDPIWPRWRNSRMLNTLLIKLNVWPNQVLRDHQLLPLLISKLYFKQYKREVNLQYQDMY